MQKQRNETKNKAMKLLIMAWVLLFTGLASLIPGVILIVEGTTDAEFLLSILSVLTAGLQWLYALRFFIDWAGE